MSANTTSPVTHSVFTLAGPVTTTTTISSPSDSLSRRTHLHMRIHHAHVNATIRHIHSLGLGLPSTMHQSQRRTRAVAHTILPPTATTTAAVSTTNVAVHAPASRRPLAATIINGLPTPPETPASGPALQTQTHVRPMLPTRRSRTHAARTGFHGVGAGLSFGLNVFGDDPVLTPRARFSADDDVRRTPRAPVRGGREGYFYDVSATTRVEENEGAENGFRAI